MGMVLESCQIPLKAFGKSKKNFVRKTCFFGAEGLELGLGLDKKKKIISKKTSPITRTKISNVQDNLSKPSALFVAFDKGRLTRFNTYTNIKY